MASTPPVTLYESTFGRLYNAARRARPGGAMPTDLAAADPALANMPIIFQATLPPPVRDRLRNSPVLSNEIQLTLGSEIMTAVRGFVDGAMQTIWAQRARSPGATRVAVQALLNNRRPALEERVTQLIKSSLQRSNDWDAYKFDSQKEVTRISLTLVLAGVSAAIAPPTAGASAGLLAVTLIRGLTDAFKKFCELARTAEESRNKLIKEIGRLQSAYRKGRGVGHASQLGGAVLHALTVGKMASSVTADPVPGLTRIKTELSAYKGKLGHLQQMSERLARQLYDALRLLDEARAAELAFALTPRYAELTRKIQDLLEGKVSGWRHGFRHKMTISSAWEDANKGIQLLVPVEAMFNELKRREGDVMWIDRLLTMLTNLGVSLAGYNAAMAAHGDHEGVLEALKFKSHGGETSPTGISSFLLGLGRQGMSLFKDANALGKELGGPDLGQWKGKPDSPDRLLREVQNEFAWDRPPPPQPRRPNNPNGFGDAVGAQPVLPSLGANFGDGSLGIELRTFGNR